MSANSSPALSRTQIRSQFVASRVIPVLVFNESEPAADTAKALVDGGISVIEVTLRTDASWQALENILTALPDAIIGAGTVLTEAQLDRALAMGVSFAVSPGLDEQLVNKAKERNLFYLPGVTTASEIMLANRLDLTDLKFFPAEVAGGIPLLQSFRSPFPNIAFCPTGGINATSAEAYLALDNVFCVGGSFLATAEEIKTRQWRQITDKARKITYK